MSRNIFEIQNLECAYLHQEQGRKKVVLAIEKLLIPEGKLTMILGLSGSGKSTLIETLGLMNNTIVNGSVSCFPGDDCVVRYPDIWRYPSELTRIRSRHLSFIFQNDFLMPHYSTVENMLIGSWSSGSGPAGSGETEILRSWCVKTGLDFDEVSKKRPAELSVGQRQRLSFIRAIMKDYTILFGDEPTGNLDDVHARLLLDELKESIRMNSRKSAIVVSHNIRLSVEKADFIIVLSPGNGTVYHVSVENVFKHTAAGWETNHGAAVPDIELELLIRETAEIRNTN